MSDSPLPGFMRGLSMPFRGFGFVLRNPGLVRFWGIPVFVVLVLLFAGCGISRDVSHWLADRAVPIAATDEGVTRYMRQAGHELSQAFAFVVGLLLTTIASVLLSPVIAAPFNERISEEVERLELGLPLPDFSAGKVVRDVARTVRIEAMKLGLYLAVVGPLYLVGVVLPPLSLISTVLGFVFTVYYFALDYVDPPLTRRSIAARERFRLLVRHPAAMFGFGVGVSILLWIPLLQLFFMPAAVVGGTRLCHELRLYPREGDAASPPPG